MKKEYKYLTPADRERIQEYKYQSFEMRLKYTLMFGINTLLFTALITQGLLPKMEGVWYYINFIIVFAPSILLVVFINRNMTKLNKKREEFKNLTQGEKDEYLHGRG
jgi:uncharacterized membrane protein